MKNTAYILLLGLCFIITSCGDKENKEDNSASQDTAVASYKQLPEIKPISNEKLTEINKWKKFKELSNLMEKFQDQNSGDLTYFAEEFIRLDTEIEKDSLFPEKFNVPDVKSRLVVFKTFSNQFKTRLDENAPIDSINVSREKLLVTYNAIRQQLSETLKSKIYQDFIKEK
ncbi:hypothetical protein JoomaDRAFT_1615 [Galbibacter orientalis DSM 19592]|uniref:Lipoprotein n=1 Tax=Galbibacter orientalis DSM 19592 TaxID=926559 RepID=I3C4T4_9FLAO|nr:hypothetical protein [Galbibacter orientalis]EIJ38627.1 hypothetical protein JoomaDRAFT_1615 [Galbibacter orientalis DSM 19592]